MNKKSTIEQQLKLLDMYENDKKNESKKRVRKKKEPFELMRIREIYKPDVVRVFHSRL